MVSASSAPAISGEKTTSENSLSSSNATKLTLANQVHYESVIIIIAGVISTEQASHKRFMSISNSAEGERRMVNLIICNMSCFLGSALLSCTNKQIFQQESSSVKPAQKYIAAQKDIDAQKEIAAQKDIDAQKDIAAQKEKVAQKNIASQKNKDAQKGIAAQKSGSDKQIDKSRTTSVRRRIFRTTKSKTVIGSDAFTNLKMFSENTEEDLIEAKKTTKTVDERIRNAEEKHRMLSRTRSTHLDNDKSLRKSLLTSRMGSSLDNEPRDSNDNSVKVQAEVHAQGEFASTLDNVD